MKLDKVSIFANTKKLETKKVVNEMISFFSTKGINAELVKLSSSEKDLKIEAPACDLAVSVGGDGTVLTCASILEKTNIPVLAVKMGTFGYITEASVDEYKDVLDEYIKGKTKPVKRMRIEAQICRDKKVVFKGSALNDITVSSAVRAKTAHLNLSINGTFAASLKCDGIIVATPTGSTAYNLSAGGPILEETLDSMIINPICSFTLSARPLVVDKKDKIEITIPKETISTVVSCDGHSAFTLKENDVITITKSEYCTLLINNKKRNSIDVLRDKLGWAGGFNA